jgi:hypothetical protein
MEPESALPCSQEPATGLYIESYASSPHFSTLVIILSSIYA